MTDINDTPFSRNSVRAALKQWHTPRQLGEHVLAAQPFTELHGSSGRGTLLREILRRGIESLKPLSDPNDDIGAGVPNAGDKRWRPYLILSQQFIAQRKPDAIAAQLGLVRGSFHHEQARALDLLGSWLAELAQAPAPTPVLTPLHIAPPRPPHPLIGRDALRDALKQQLLHNAHNGCVALHGLPGVGKTALALDLANDAALIQHFSDGVLWVGLGQQPDALAALGIWASALGLSPDDIRRLNSITARRHAIRAVIGLRKLLLVIDDAWHIDTAHLFQLGGPNCGYVLTTRLPNVALAFADSGAITIGELTEAEGMALLAQHAPEVVHSHPAAMHNLIRQTGGLPLALALLGRQLRKASAGNLPRRIQQTLNALAAPSEASQTLNEVIRSSHAALPPTACAALAALSIFPPKPNSFAEDAALAVMDGGPTILDMLLDDGLIEARAGRYSLHQTIADFARTENSLKRPEHFKPHQQFALFYCGYAQTHSNDFAALDAELVNMLAALAQATTLGLNEDLLRASHALYPFLEARGLLDQAEAILAQAEITASTTAIAITYPDLRARTLRQRGQLARRRGDYDVAQAYFDAALALLIPPITEFSDEQAHILLHLTTLANDRGDRDHAETLGQQALMLARRLNQPQLITHILTQLAAAAGFRGHFDDAQMRLREAMRLAQANHDTRNLALLHLGLGFLASWLGQVAEAEAEFEQSVALARQHDQRETASIVRALQGWVATNLGDYERAVTLSNEGLALIREGSFCESVALHYANLGLVAFNRGHDTEGEALTAKGLAAVRQIKHLEGECLLMGNLARQLFERGEWDESERISYAALKIADDIGFWDLMSPLLATLGEVLNARGDYDNADGLLMVALSLAHQMQRPWLVMYGQCVWGECYLQRTDIDKAYAAFYEARVTAQCVGSRSFLAIALFGLARVAQTQANGAEAMTLAGESLRLFRAIGHKYVARVAAFLGSI